MKKLLLLFFIGFSLFGYAQKFQLTDTLGNPYQHEQTILKAFTEADLSLAGDFIVNFLVKNLTVEELQMKTIRTDIEIIDDMEVNLCVGIYCYPPWIDTVNYSVSSESNELFAFHLIPKDKFGFCKYKLNFSTENETITIYLNIDVQKLSINENRNENLSLSIYPNPAPVNSKINVSFSLADKQEYYRLAFRNILGTEVLSLPVNPYENKISVDISNLKPGIYFYAIENKNQILIAKKLIIK